MAVYVCLSQGLTDVIAETVWVTDLVMAMTLL